MSRSHVHWGQKFTLVNAQKQAQSAIAADFELQFGTNQLGKNTSPLYRVAPGDPPFLILHGADDRIIAPHHSQDLAKRLQAAGVPFTLVMIQYDSHGLAVPTAGQVEQPGPATLIQMIFNFFTRTLAA